MPITVHQKHLLHKVNNTQYRWENLDEWQLIWNLFPLNSYCHGLMLLTLRLAPVTVDSHRSQLLFYHHSSAVFDYLKGTSQNYRRIQDTETRSHILNSPELEVTTGTYWNTLESKTHSYSQPYCVKLSHFSKGWLRENPRKCEISSPQKLVFNLEITFAEPRNLVDFITKVAYMSLEFCCLLRDLSLWLVFKVV